MFATLWVQAKPVSPEKMVSEGYLRLVLHKLRQLHQTQVPFKGVTELPVFCPVGMAQMALGQLRKASPVLGQHHDRIRRLIDEAQAAIAAHPTALKLCHNDFHQHNVLIDAEDQPWIVDWAHAGWNDPYFDLAWLACNLDLPLHTATLSQILRTYQDGTSKQDVEKLGSYMRFADLLLFAWCAGQDDKGQTDDAAYFFERVCRHSVS